MGYSISTENIRIQNPLSRDQEMMRPHLLPGFMSAAALNINRGQKYLKFFELGKVYLASGEREALGILSWGQQTADWRDRARGSASYYDLKGVVEEALAKLGCGNVLFKKMDLDEPLFAHGVSANIFLGEERIGFIGEIQNSILQNWSIKQGIIFYAQIDLRHILDQAERDREFTSIPEYPEIVHDLSLAVKEDVSYQQIKDVIEGYKAQYLTSVQFVEQYLGEKLPTGHRGYTISLVYQSAQKTLLDSEILSIHEGVCQELITKLGVIKR
jgi:phenylalanyl-tRNA synthetase beta chain